MSYREKSIHFLNKISPIELKGDATIPIQAPKYDITCAINFYKRTDLLKNILSCLCEQSLGKSNFEVLLIEDRGGTKDGRKISNEYKEKLNIKYTVLDKNFGTMGYARNFSIQESSGQYILFLDDDTIILNKNFLKDLLQIFKENNADCVLPKGYASFCIVKDRYQFHDPYFPTNRCTAYSIETLRDLNGFISSFIGQEDVEFTVRLIASGKKITKTDIIEYYHPPLIYKNFSKSASVGYSFTNLYGKYPFFIWILLLINGCRYLPYGLFPVNSKYRNQFKFSCGFLFGIVDRILGKRPGYN